jgi:hypothetical protein
MEISRQQNAAQERARAALTLMPETFVRNWQMTGLRVLRAQERMLYGMMSAARLEMQFGQDLIMNRMAHFNARKDEEGRSEGAFQELDRLITMIREVTEELRSGFNEATQLLTETADEVIQDTTTKLGTATRAATDGVADATHETLQSSGKAAKKVSESAAETANAEKEERRRSG